MLTCFHVYYCIIQQEDESPSPVLAPELKTEFKSEPQENNPVKLTAAGLDISIPPASRPNKKRRTRCDDAKNCNGAALKKSNIESVSHFSIFTVNM